MKTNPFVLSPAIPDEFFCDRQNESASLIKSINNPETRIMCIYIISYDHLKKRMYKLAENESKNLLLDIKLYEDKISNNNDDSNSKLK